MLNVVTATNMASLCLVCPSYSPAHPLSVMPFYPNHFKPDSCSWHVFSDMWKKVHGEAQNGLGVYGG